MSQLRACLSVSGAFLLAALFAAAPPVHAQNASRAAPPPGKALVFVYRSDRAPVAAQVPVFLNQARAGEVANGTFIIATINPGRTFLRVGDQTAPTYAFPAVANQSYFVQVGALAGTKPLRTEVRLVGEVEGRRSLAKSRFLGAIAIAPGAPPAPAAAPPRVQPPAAAAPRVQPPPPPAPAATPARPRPSEPAKPAAKPADESDDWKFALIAKAGTFKLANDTQALAGLNSKFKAASSPVFGFEGEWRNKAGYAAGGEVFYYKNELVTNPTTTPVTNEQQVIAIMANGKYYFRAADWFYPFVGAGVGFANAVYSGGSLTGSGGGLAFQGLAGMEFRFGSVGVLVQYKQLVSTTGKGDQAVKVGGGGVLAGVSVAF